MTDGEREERADRVARSALWIRVALIVLAAAFVGQAAFGAWAVLSGAAARDEICEATRAERDVLRTVLKRARDVGLENTTDPEEERVIRGFYDGLLNNEVPAIECNKDGSPEPVTTKEEER